MKQLGDLDKPGELRRVENAFKTVEDGSNLCGIRQVPRLTVSQWVKLACVEKKTLLNSSQLLLL